MIGLDAIAVDHLSCDYCSAPAGSRCRTTSGALASYTHSLRTRAVYTAWRQGYGEGLRDAVQSPEYAARWAARTPSV